MLMKGKWMENGMKRRVWEVLEEVFEGKGI